MTQENIFSLLDRFGPFATGDRPPALAPLSPEARLFAKGLAEAGMTTRYRILRNQIFEFLDVRSFAGIQAIINDPVRRKLANERAYRLLGNMFGIEGNAREVILRVNTYSRTADGVINYLKGKVYFLLDGEKIGAPILHSLLVEFFPPAADTAKPSPDKL